jgi:hypothetical protein
LRAHREWLRILPQDALTLRHHWQSLPGEVRHHLPLAAEAARAFIAQGACAHAQHFIQDALEEQWDSELAALYGNCAQGDALGRIANAEEGLREDSQDAHGDNLTTSLIGPVSVKSECPPSEPFFLRRQPAGRRWSGFEETPAIEAMLSCPAASAGHHLVVQNNSTPASMARSTLGSRDS